MKRLAFIAVLIVIFCFIFAVNIFAIDVDSLDDITNAISSASDGESITVNLTADILVPNTASAIKLEKNLTLTVNFNGFTLFTNPGGGGAGSVYGIKINHGDAKLILNGISSVDAMNYIEPSDQQLTVKDGAVIDPNDLTDVKSPDIATNGPAIMLLSGSIVMNNMYIHQYNSGEWAIHCQHSSTAEKIVTNMTMENSIIRMPHDSVFGALGTRGGNSKIQESLCKFENSVIYGINGNRGEYWSFGIGSYVRNCRFKGVGIILDSYLNTNKATGDNPVEFRNVIFENKSLGIYTGRMHANLIDCQFPNGMELTVSSDSAGVSKLIMTISPTCTEDGKQAYTAAKAKMTSFEEFLTVVPEYTENNRRLGHNYVQEDVYSAYCPLGSWYNIACSRCDYRDVLNLDDKEATPKAHNHSSFTNLVYADGYSKAGVRIYSCSESNCSSCAEISTDKPLIFFKGFSASIDGKEICVSYELDAEALSQLKILNGNFKYGVAAASAQKAPNGRLLEVNTQYNTVDAVSNCVAKTELKESIYTRIDFKLSGDFANTQGNMSLLISAYVFDGKEIKYICSDNDTETVIPIAYTTLTNT